MSHEHVSPRAGESAPFHFQDRWSVKADADAVWAVLEQVHAWPQWWPGLTEADVTVAGPSGIAAGSRADIRIRTPLGVPLDFSLDVREVQPGRRVVLDAAGDLRGEGIWTLTESQGLTHIDSLWCVVSPRPLIRLLRPTAGLMHSAVMRAGGRGLAARVDGAQRP